MRLHALPSLGVRLPVVNGRVPPHALLRHVPAKRPSGRFAPKSDVGLLRNEPVEAGVHQNGLSVRKVIFRTDRFGEDAVGIAVQNKIRIGTQLVRLEDHCHVPKHPLVGPFFAALRPFEKSVGLQTRQANSVPALRRLVQIRLGDDYCYARESLAVRGDGQQTT